MCCWKNGKGKERPMEEYAQITLDQWLQWKEDIRRKLEETAGNFVYIGYRLKQIRDSGMYGGAADIFGFAEKEYGLGKSTVSRFIAINERYSEGGNSLELKEEFRGFSSSKLSEMLTLPDSEIQLITERTTIREIRELKGFNSQEPEEAGKEPEAGMPQKDADGTEWTPLERCLIDFFSARKEMLDSIMGHLDTEPKGYREAAELMAPSGQASHRKGIVFLFLYDWDTGVKYKLLTEPEPVAMSWKGLLDAIRGIYGDCCRPDVWESFYREHGAEKGQRGNYAPAQPDQEAEAVAMPQQDGGPNPEKEPGRAGAEEAHPEHATEKAEGAAGKAMEDIEGARPGPEEQMPGQMDITDYPEAAPAQPDQGEEAVATSQQGTPAETEERLEDIGAEAAGDSGNEEMAGLPSTKSIKEPDSEGRTSEACDSDNADTAMASMAAGAKGADTDAGAPPSGTGEEAAVDAALRMEELWMEAWGHLDSLTKFFTIWDGKEIPLEFLEKAYQDAVSLEAGIDLLLDMRKEGDGWPRA